MKFELFLLKYLTSRDAIVPSIVWIDCARKVYTALLPAQPLYTTDSDDTLMVRKIDTEQAYVGGSSCLESLTYLDSMRRWMKWIKE